MKPDPRRNPEDRTRRTTQSEVEIIAEKYGTSRLKKRTTESEVEIVAQKYGRLHLKRRTTQSEVEFFVERRKITSFGQILRNKKI